MEEYISVVIVVRIMSVRKVVLSNSPILDISIPSFT
jgi:hypothetical protein